MQSQDEASTNIPVAPVTTLTANTSARPVDILASPEVTLTSPEDTPASPEDYIEGALSSPAATTVSNPECPATCSESDMREDCSISEKSNDDQLHFDAT
eukprot:Em0008g990a